MIEMAEGFEKGTKRSLLARTERVSLHSRFTMSASQIRSGTS
jgi:hypothetical protein